MTRLHLFLALFAFALSAVPAVADTLDCQNPVRFGESAKSLFARFGARAKIGERGTEMGIEKGVTLFGGDRKRRLFVWFTDQTLSHASSVTATDDATAWSVHGLRLGSALADVETANGGLVGVYGFAVDYSGTVVFHGGALTKALAPCALVIRLMPPPGVRVPDAYGSDVEHPSTDPVIRALAPAVYELSIDGPEAPELR